MKKLFFGFALMLSSLTYAGPRSIDVFVTPMEMLNGDGFTRPLTAPSTEGPYLEMFKGNTVLSLSPTTGISMTATVIAPTDIKYGGQMRFGVTAMYQAVTNSAGLSATTKVQFTTYSDANALTITTTTAYAQVYMNAAGQHARPTMVELGTVPNVYPGQVITVYVERATGDNAVISFYNLYAIFDNPVKGWGR